MKKFFLLLLMAAGVCVAQNKPAKVADIDNSAFNKKLAESLGADKYGMKNYVLVIMKTGGKDQPDAKKKAAIFDGHMRNINRMADEGQLVLAGPFGKNDAQYRGLYLFNVATIEEAKKLTETDPAIESDLLTAEYYPWYGSAALMQVNDVHKTISEEKL